MISDVFNPSSRSPITETEVLAVISWGQSCELFGYDKKKMELLCIEFMVPRDPRPIAPSLPLAS